MNRLLLACFALLLTPVLVRAQTPITHAEYQQGGAAFPVLLRGIVLNNPADMSDSTPNFVAQPFNVSTYWQIFVQAVEAGDHGGTAVYMAQNYGNIPPHLDLGTFTPDPSASYTNQEWQNQLDRVNGYGQNAPGTLPSPGYQLQAGDMVEIVARGGLSFGGKMNVNEQHFKTVNYAADPELSFDVRFVEHVGLPAPAQIELADIWDSSTNNVLFDPTRATGGEFYQGSYVSLNNVRLADGQAAGWLAGEAVTVVDVAGREFTVQLGTSALFAPGNAPVGFFNARGIFNQEAPAGGPFDVGYQVWVTDPDAITLVPEPHSLVLAGAGLAALVALRRRRLLR